MTTQTNIYFGMIEKFEVEVIQDTMSKSTLHVSVENESGDQVKLYMNKEQIEELISKMKEALNEYSTY